MDIAAMITKLFVKNGMIFGFMLLGVIMYVSFKLGALTKGRVHGSAIAIFLGLVLAYIGGEMTGGSKGIADVPLFAGMGLVGGAMFRDFAIVSTAFGADLREIKKVGWRGVASLFIGEFICLVAGISARLYQCGRYGHHRGRRCDLRCRTCHRRGSRRVL